jgi:alpha-L-arabinofuranosidase
MKKYTFLVFLLICSFFGLFAQSTFTIDASQPGITISPRLYGIFFEEINHAGEGGLYAEMVLNRDFETTSIPVGSSMAGNLVRTKETWQERKVFGNELHGWSFLSEGGANGDIRLQNVHPLNEKNPASMRLIVTKTGSRSGVYNSGFWGMNFRQGETYHLSFYARSSGNKKLDVTVSLESPNGNRIYAEKKMTQVGGNWQKYECLLEPTASDNLGRLALTISQPDTLWLDVVSLFPQKTYMKRPNGLRTDIMQMLAGLKPAFVRFPGGAIVGGMNLDNRIQWKNSIGDISQRKGTMNLWGYFTTNGLGYHEYLQLCEDLKADALWVCNPGFSDNYRKAEYCKPEEVQLFVQEALDALEYALGPVDSEWGAKRAANGHPETFPLKYIEIGNEASGEVYRTNYKLFYDAIRPKYPQVKIISNYRSIPGSVVEIRDDHKYGSPESFIKAFNQYDNADRKGPEIYVGEYGCTTGVGQGNLKGALSEAVYLMGLEKNSDIVTMSSYAPLFFHVNDNAWPGNMIGFDNQSVFGRTSYWVNRMMAENRPDFLFNTLSTDSVKNLFCISGYDKTTDEIIIKVVNTSAQPQKAAFHFKGIRFPGPTVTTITLTHTDCTAENSLYNTHVVIPQKSQISKGKEDIEKEFAPWSFTILRVKTSELKIDKPTIK